MMITILPVHLLSEQKMRQVIFLRPDFYPPVFSVATPKNFY
jgi:hypothetical protein